MIREPYNVNPYNSTIDTSRVNNFGFTFSGDELGSWKVEIAKNNTSPEIVYTSKEFFPEDAGYSRIFDSDIVEGTLLPSTVASGDGETDGLIRRIYSVNGYPFNSSVVRLVLNEKEDEPDSGIEITSIESSSMEGGYMVVTSSSLGRDGTNVKIQGYDENAVQVGSTVTNGTFHFMGYVLTVEKNSAIKVGQSVEVEDTIFKIAKINNSDNTYAQLYIAAGQDEVEIASSGVDVASFETIGIAGVSNCEVRLEPIQDLSNGDPSPSNICPIYPANRKNLLDINGTWTSTTDASKTTNGNSIIITCVTSGTYRSIYYDIPITSEMIGQKLIVSWKSIEASSTNDWRIILRARDSGGTQLAEIANTGSGTSVTTSALPASTDHVRVLLYGTYSVSAAQGASITYENLQVELGSIVTGYAIYQGIGVQRTGFNLWDGVIEQGSINTSTGINSSSTSYCRSKNAIKIIPTETYYCKADHNVYMFFYDKNMKYISYSSTHQANKSFKPIDLNANYANAQYLRFRYDNSGTITDKNVCISFSDSVKNGQYEAPNSEVYSISLGRDVYGGTVDLTTGKLTVTMGIKDLGSLSYTKSSEMFYASISDMAIKATVVSDRYEFVGNFGNVTQAQNGTTNGQMGTSSVDTYIFIHDTGYSSASDFKTAMNGAKLVYELATPLEYDLTPTQINALSGINNVWSSGKINVLVYDYDLIIPEE